MSGQLKRGINLQSVNGVNYTVKNFIGEGGQGEVYEVTDGRKNLALKWYHKHTATPRQEKILRNLIDAGKPSEDFLWPEDLIISHEKKSFGYTMALRPPEYKGIVDLMKRRVEPTFFNLCKACFNLTKGYQALHKAGYQYRDISFGNLFFNPDNGKVLICDNDNVVPNGEKGGGVLGTPTFMAPEIVRGEAYPSRNTDQYSLAVLLFYMLMLHHPLEGKREFNIHCMDMPARNKIYGTNPIFIWDPADDSNRPVKGHQDNPIIYWQIYPQYIRELFTTAFTVGLKEPNRRVTEREWLGAFSNLLAGLIKCPKCGPENFYNPNHAVNCWSCGNEVRMPSKLVVDSKNFLITANTKIFSHFINDDNDIDTVLADVKQNPKNPDVWGLRNLTNKSWTYIKKDNSMIVVEPGKSAKIARDVEISFGKVKGHFE